MGDAFTIFLLVLILLAVLSRETFVVGLLYLFVGALVAGRWWSGRVINRLSFTRKFDHQVFPDETVQVQLDLHNNSLLPAVWLRVQDYYPIEVAEANSFSQVVSLGPKEKTRLNYQLKAHKRGYYTIGPLQMSSGDLLGMTADQQSQGAADHLIVYPRVISFTKVNLPSRSPMGTLRDIQPIFEDPTRPAGKREYQNGDSLRRIDWKASASIGRLQTKQFEPSIALETTIFLNLDQQDYSLKTRFDASELSIVVAASLANWIISKRQSTGLITNGMDPLSVDTRPIPIPARKGRAHLMRILEILARIRALETTPFITLFRQNRVHLPWGTTAIIITGSAEPDIFDELLQARHAGVSPVLILCGEHPSHHQATRHAKLFGIPVQVLRDEKDLDIWRT